MLSRRVFLSSLLLALTGCGWRKTSHETTPLNELPPVPKLRQLEPGVSFGEAILPRTDGSRSKLWVYLPTPRPKGELPCILIAPAGTPLIHGNDVGEGSRPEHLPYVRAGFAVVAYDLDGIPGENPTDERLAAAIRDFKDAEFGVANARVALDFALVRLKADPKQIFVAGHSSAATLALQVAAAEPRVKKCIAYAPCVNLKARLGKGLAEIDPAIPGIQDAILAASPDKNIAAIRIPTFLFHARDDSNVPFEETARYAEALRKINPAVTFVAADSGDHYDSMIQRGIPAGIRWLKGK